MNFLAFDLGAESGRAILAQCKSGILNLHEIYRFPNEPVLYQGEPIGTSPVCFMR